MDSWPAGSRRSDGRRSDGRPPSRADPVAAWASPAIGGPLGRHALTTNRGFFSATTVFLISSFALFAVGVLFQGRCLGTNWSSPGDLSHMCSSRLIDHYHAMIHASGMNLSDLPVGAVVTDYPQVVGASGTRALLHIVGALGPAGSTAGMFTIAMMVDAAALAFVVLGTARLLGFRRRWQLGVVGLSAVIVFAAPVSFELVAVALAVWALVIWTDDRWAGHGWLAGVLLGLAALVSPIALVVLAAVLIHGLRVRGAKLRQLIVLTGCGVGVTAVGWLADPAAADMLRYWSDYGVGPGSLWWLTEIGSVTSLQGVEVAASGAIIALILITTGVFAYRRPDMWKLETILAVTLVSCLIAAPALPPQSSLWLIPVAALTAPSWPVQLPWMFCEVCFAISLSLYRLEEADPGKGVATWILVVFLLARLLSIVTLLLIRPADDGFVTPGRWRTRPRRTESEGNDKVVWRGE